MLIAGVAGSAATAVRACSPRFIRRWRLYPGTEVTGAGVPGQEAVQVQVGDGFPAVAAAFVEVGGAILHNPRFGVLRLPTGSGRRASQPVKALDQIDVRISLVSELAQPDDSPGTVLAIHSPWRDNDVACAVPHQGRRVYRVDPDALALLRSYFDAFWNRSLEGFRRTAEKTTRTPAGCPGAGRDDPQPDPPGGAQ